MVCQNIYERDKIRCDIYGTKILTKEQQQVKFCIAKLPEMKQNYGQTMENMKGIEYYMMQYICGLQKNAQQTGRDEGSKSFRSLSCR